MGRDFAGRRWGPRPVDLDIIFYGDRHYQVRGRAALRSYASPSVAVALLWVAKNRMHPAHCFCMREHSPGGMCWIWPSAYRAVLRMSSIARP